MARHLLDFIKRRRALYFFRTDFPCRLRCFPRGLAGVDFGTRTMSAYGRFAKTRERSGGVSYEDLGCSKHPADVLSRKSLSLPDT